MRVRVRWGWVGPFEAALLEKNPRRWATLRRDGATCDLITIDLPRSAKQRRKTWSGEITAVSDEWLGALGWGPEPTARQPVGAWPNRLPEPHALVKSR
jgi:hypothetical protein